jgi:hypothetical protein
MLIKKGSLIAALLTMGLFACDQNENANKVTVKPDTRRIPVSVNDSMILSIDRSPMDIIYFPEDYPKQKMMTPDLPNPVARVMYSRPQKNGRVIFADTSVTQNVIQHYGEEWRLGANEATEIEFFKPVSIGGKKLPAGRYILYCIPYPGTWKIIFNSNLYSWGLHIDKTKDQAEIELPVIKNNVDIEFFTMVFQNSTYGCDLVMAWGNVKVALPVNF